MHWQHQNMVNSVEQIWCGGQLHLAMHWQHQNMVNSVEQIWCGGQLHLAMHWQHQNNPCSYQLLDGFTSLAS